VSTRNHHPEAYKAQRPGVKHILVGKFFCWKHTADSRLLRYSLCHRSLHHSEIQCYTPRKDSISRPTGAGSIHTLTDDINPPTEPPPHSHHSTESSEHSVHRRVASPVLRSLMAKRLFHSCRSPSAAAAVTPTTTHLLAIQQPHAVPDAAYCPRGVPRRRSQHPAKCGAGDDGGADGVLPPAHGTPAYRWLKSSHWHVIEASAYATAAADGDDAPRLKIDVRRRVRRCSRRRRGRALHLRRAAPASWLSDDDSGWFSTDDEERAYAESSTLVTTTSSTTTTTESSSMGANGTGAGAGNKEVEKEQVQAVAVGFAVVKRSEDPRADFRRSMAEMVVGRGIYDADGLERLLRCFLALNDQRHRRDIVAAFGDVWQAVFANPALSQGAVTSPHASSSGKATPTVCHP
jgi:uncharacterized protein (TIGR01568 family)